jgi:hypothetical protein
MASKPGPTSEDKVSGGSEPAASNVVIHTELDKQTTAEDSSMTTDSKSAGGFGVKVVFWLVIIILGFMYIRSLAKHPQSDEATTTSVEQEAVETTTAVESTADDAAANQDAPVVTSSEEQAESSVETPAMGGSESAASAAGTADREQGDTPVESSSVATEEQVTTADQALSTTDEPSAAASGAAEEPAVAAGEESSAAGETAAATAGQAASQSFRDQHAESVSKILKEFDDLRNAARAEMEAMRNLRDAERDLQDAMVPPPPRPAWPGPGYAPYGGYPPVQQGYAPPYYRY